MSCPKIRLTSRTAGTVTSTSGPSTLLNESDLPTRYEVLPQSDASVALAIYSAEPPAGVVPARGSTEIVVHLATERLGRMNLPVFINVVGLTPGNTARMEPREAVAVQCDRECTWAGS